MAGADEAYSELQLIPSVSAALIRGVVSSERRNIPAMIRAACSGRLGWSVSGRGTPGG